MSQAQAHLDWWTRIADADVFFSRRRLKWVTLGRQALMIEEKYLYEGTLLFFMKIYFIFTKQDYRKQTFYLLLLCFLHFTEQVICAASGVSSWNMTEGWSPIYLNVPFKVWDCIKDSWHQQHWIFSCCL